MEAKDIIDKAIREKRKNLTEYESKLLLKKYGLPVVEETVVADAEEAAARAQSLKSPVVLKALGTRLTHKTEMGLVKLGLNSAQEVSSAAMEMKKIAGSDLEGFLLQPQISGKREFVAGMFNDEQFGPVIMFGLGGVFTEALEDAVFRIAPIDEREALSMINGISSQKLLNAFRGEAAVDKASLAGALAGLSRVALENPDISEIDINPLIAGPDGRVTAVDALVVLGEKRTPDAAKPDIDPRAIGKMFYPRSIAFVGASASFGKWGYSLFTCLVRGGFRGSIYLVNAKEENIAGRPVYRTIADIPENVDLAVVTIPAAAVPELIPRLQAKGIRSMLLITSGFSETGEAGRRLEKEIVEKAQGAGILILGPNTMGICNPHNQFYCMAAHVRPRPGTTSLVAQSGNLGTQLLAFAEKEGIDMRAFCGSGNEAMITIEDYMRCFEVDDLTRTVVLYLESIKDGRRFFETAKRVGHKKPVIVLKGGRTEAGNRAAASHTGAMASNLKIFNAACRQAGVVMASHTMDILDLSAAFSSLPLPGGNRVAIMSLGGGWGVVATDLCIENGLKVPRLPDEIIQHIDRILPPYWSRSNPIDLVGELDIKLPMMVTEELLKWEGCDAVIHLGIVGRMPFVKKTIASAITADQNQDRGFMEAVSKAMHDAEQQFTERMIQLMDAYKKPVLGVCLLPDENTRTINEIADHQFKAVTFVTPERAVGALARMYEYRSWLSSEGVC